MRPDLAVILHALHRSRVRVAVLLELDALKLAYPGQLERATGIRAERIHAALHGTEAEYRPEHALVALRLVRRMATLRGPAYEITRRGERVVRMLAREMREGRARRGRWARAVAGF